MASEERNQEENKNTRKMHELAELLNVLLSKVEIAQIPNESTENYGNVKCNYEEMDQDMQEDESSMLCDMLYDMFEMVEENIPLRYTGADVTTGVLGIIALHNQSAVKVITSLLIQLQMLQSQLMENEKEKIELLKKNNELLQKLLEKEDQKKHP